MMRLWERNDAPPPVDGAPDAAGAHPYLVLCHRSPGDAASPARDGAPGDDDRDERDDRDEQADRADREKGRDGGGFGLGGGSTHEHRAVVYQWVRISR